jgi:hypothetical protein
VLGNEVKLSATIMAHPSRAESVTRLQRMLDRDVPVTWDQIGDRWETGRRALLSYDQNASHHLIVQDDALPAGDLCKALEHWIPQLPDSVLCLYAGNIGKFASLVRSQNPKTPTWLKMRKVQWGVALVIPTNRIESAVAFGDQCAVPNYDMRLSLWAQSVRLPVLYPLPSWVNHDPGPSLVPGHGSKRQAYKCLPVSQSALDWSNTKPRIVTLPDFTRPGDGAPLQPGRRGPKRSVFTMSASTNQRGRRR